MPGCSRYGDKAATLRNFAEDSWQKAAFAEFAAALDSEERPFPCIFGVSGYRADQLRYLFLDGPDLPALAENLAHYVASCRAYGGNTSLVVFMPALPGQSLAGYRAAFWSMLQGLAAIDRHAWPENVPQQLDDPLWEFCFAGEPIFVVCNTPAHRDRRSRKAGVFMMTFQPRWVFDGLFATPLAKTRALDKIRRRLQAYDSVPPSPDLGHYGDPDNREYSQYFLEDQNIPAPCPFAHLRSGRPAAPRIRIARLSAGAPPLPAPLARYLPPQGSVELQRDAAGKEHAFHVHERDEIILVLEGGLRFYWEGGERICRPGDEIRLPANTRHGSVALEEGAVYMIACPPGGFAS